MKRDLARELFRIYKSPSRRKVITPEEDRVQRDEPTPISVTLSELITRQEWKSGLAEGNLFAEWKRIVGGEIAEHATPITLLDGCLTIQTDTTAWATQLRLMSPTIVASIQQHPEGAVVEELKVIGPNSPSWRRGLRTIRGARGPRDTYG